MKADLLQLADISQILIIIGAAIAVTTLMRPLRLSPILGYLLAGILIGPFNLGIIALTPEIHTLAELGVVFLLFTIGLELPIDRLRVMRRLVFGLGFMQVFLTSLVTGVLAYIFLQSVAQAIVIGGALALSSTALVLQTLVERGELSTQYGRAGFSTVLFQDLAVVPLIVIIPLLGSEGQPIISAMALAIANGVLLIMIVFLSGRLLIRPLFRLIDAPANPEMFTATSLLLVLATAGLSMTFGLSMALGAFLAGILLAETEFRHQVAADIQPFRGLLLGLFFMTVGMQIDLAIIADHVFYVLGIVLALVLVKGIILFALGRSFGFSKISSARYAITLSQGGEFAFVLLGLAVTENLVGQLVGKYIFLAVAISMVLTPILLRIFFPMLERLQEKVAPDEPVPPVEIGDRKGHVIIAGYGRVGRTIARVLDAENTSFVAIDLDHNKIAHARARKRPVFYGDALRIPVWRSVGANDAHSVVIAMERPALVGRIVSLLRKEFPHLKIFVRAQDAEHAKELIDAGATESIPITFQASLQLGASVLKSMGQSSEEVDQVINFLQDKYDDEEMASD